MESREKIKKLEEYKAQLSRWREMRDSSTRSSINQKTAWARREVIESGSFGTLTLTPTTDNRRVDCA